MCIRDRLQGPNKDRTLQEVKLIINKKDDPNKYDRKRADILMKFLGIEKDLPMTLSTGNDGGLANIPLNITLASKPEYAESNFPDDTTTNLNDDDDRNNSLMRVYDKLATIARGEFKKKEKVLLQWKLLRIQRRVKESYIKLKGAIGLSNIVGDKIRQQQRKAFLIVSGRRSRQRMGGIRIITEKVYERLRYAMSCLLYTSPSPRDRQKSRMPSSA
eukprot:TRINITY_DN6903_c0_g1_i1.p1 TRINITY_DN6903_c0_g1~~TRINITY_DN6903_c0_g1_i1.p1  ORF type:complete len:216 (+),score=57.83 TRINITY_DN6903_c0_g1_i1:63-710(+)